MTSTPLKSRTRFVEIPVTASQRMPWHHAEVAHTRSAFGLRISGSLNLEILQRSLNSLVRRHESLRTRIVMTGDRLSQHIDACQEYHLELVDMSDIPGDDARKSIPPPLQEFVNQKIEPSIGPLFDARAFRVAYGEHILVISIDHLITDGISIGILVEELWTLYAQGVNGQSASLPPLSLQFADYALWLENIYPAWKNVHLQYWEKRLSGAPNIRWPTEGSTAERLNVGYGIVRVPIDERLNAGLAEYARRERTLPALVALAIYVVTVSRWCDQTDLTVTLVDHGRHRARLARMLGLLASHLHLRFQLSGNETHRDMLDLVKSDCYCASSHRDFDWVPSLIPQFQSEFLFNWAAFNTDEFARTSSNGLAGRNKVEWLNLTASEAHADLAHVMPYKLLLGCGYQGRDLIANLWYRADLFSNQTIDRLTRNLRFSLESTIYGPSVIPSVDQ